MSYLSRMNVLPARTLRVMVLEDDDLLRERILLPGLADFGFNVTGARSAAELYRRMLTEHFDVIVLDIGLPDEDGLTVARHLRKLSPIGIIMLTGSKRRADQIGALSGGADLFLSKPVDVELLAANLHSLARRLQIPLRGSLQRMSAVDEPGKCWRLETDGWCLISPEGAMVALSVPERCVMQRLFAAHGHPVSREALIGALSEDVYEFDPHRLEMLVYRLRRKCSEQIGSALPLMTARGAGYVFVSEIAVGDKSTADAGQELSPQPAAT